MSEKKYVEDAAKDNQKDEKAEKAEKTEKTGKFTPKHWAVIGSAAVLIVLAGAMMFVFGGSSAEKLQKQLDLGQKYLEEMNYEEAIVAFEAAIEIDPMSVDAYLGLVEVYIRTGEFDTALEYAKKGYEATGDERLKEKIDMIERGNITASNGWTMKAYHYDEAGVLKWYAIYRYGKHGIVGYSEYRVDGSLLEEQEYQYDEEGNNTATRWYNSDGTSGKYYEHEYDSEGNRIETRHYGSDGTLEGYYEYEYDSEGNCMASRYYGSDGILSGYWEKEYDSKGRTVANRWYNSDGTLVDYYENEYDSEGNQIATREYDGSGNLLSETKYE